MRWLKITAKKAGKATISLKYNGKVYKCKVVVKKKSAAGQNDKPATQIKTAKYTYKVYQLNDIYSAYYSPHKCWFGNEGVFYIKTDNPDPSTFAICEKNKDKVIFNSSFNDFVDVDYVAEDDWGAGGRRVSGGYLHLADSSDLLDYSAGNHTFEIRESEHSDIGFKYRQSVTAMEFKIYFRDQEEEFKGWMDDIIKTQTTNNMNVHEKMDTISTHLRFSSRYWPNKHLVSLEKPIFKTLRWESSIAPALLVEFGDRIGYPLTDMYSVYNRDTEDWVRYHAYAKGEYQGETYYYTCCPLSETGYIDMDFVEKIDFSKYN